LFVWDLETAPLPEPLTQTQQARLKTDAAVHVARGRSAEDADALARSLSPHLAFICAAGFALVPYDELQATRTQEEAEAFWRRRRVHRLVAITPTEELGLLRSFLGRVQEASAYARGKREALRFVTFNGKSFDVDMLVGRCLKSGVPLPDVPGLLDRHRYQHRLHTDLRSVFERTATRLADLCALLGVPDPKAEGDGSRVADLVRAGDRDALAHYSAADVRATMQCFRRARELGIPIAR
jgi:hypothetical protein